MEDLLLLLFEPWFLSAVAGNCCSVLNLLSERDIVGVDWCFLTFISFFFLQFSQYNDLEMLSLLSKIYRVAVAI